MADQSCAWPVSRRQFLRGTGGTAAAAAWPGSARAADERTVIRAQRGARGPTLRVKRGEEVRVRLVNDMTEPTALHWHGVRLPNAMDGVPGLTQELVKPGATFDYRFTPPDAGTFWYRPSVTSTGEQLDGLFGALIVEETESVGADRDELLLLTDVADGRAPPVDFSVRQNERVRLRLVNAGPQILPLNFNPHRAVIIATDGQPAQPFTARDGRIFLGPGNRVDVFIDATLDPGTTARVTAESPQGPITVAQLVYDKGASVRVAPLPEPKPLPPNALPERIDLRSAVRAEFRLASAMVSGDRLFTAKRGRSVVVAFANQPGMPYAAHVHGHSCRLLDALDDGWKPFWLDTVLIAPQNTTRIAFVTDNPGKWLIEARGIGQGSLIRTMWFEVT